MSPLKPLPPSLSQVNSRVEFDLEAFDKAIAEHSYRMCWSKAAMCPNRDPQQDDHHRLTCTLCNRQGWVYFDSQEISVHAMSAQLSQKFNPESRFDPGTLYVTPQSHVRMSFWDKLEMLDSRTRFSEVLRGSDATPQGYKLKYPPLDVIFVMTSTGLLIDNAIVENDRLVLPGTLAPSEFFTVVYTYRPVYIVIDLLHHVRDARIAGGTGVDQPTEFPLQVLARLDFLVDAT